MSGVLAPVVRLDCGERRGGHGGEQDIRPRRSRRAPRSARGDRRENPELRAHTLDHAAGHDLAPRTIAGTPTAVTAARIYTWKATDSEDDAPTLTFTIAVAEIPIVSVTGDADGPTLLLNSPRDGRGQRHDVP